MLATRKRVCLGLATSVVLMVACTSSGDTAAAVAAYAHGHWRCTITSERPNPHFEPLVITAVVSVADQTSGRVVLRLPNPAGSQLVRGTWRLNDDDLTVQWDKVAVQLDSNVGPTHGRDISLNADRIEIRGETRHPRRAGKWVPVGVDRRSRSVTFHFPLDRDQRAVMTCRKN